MTKQAKNIAELVKALRLLYETYCSQMGSEYNYPGDPWTPDRDADVAAQTAREALAKFKDLLK